MNILDTMIIILMKNKGSTMSYDQECEEFVITFQKGNLLIPVECYLSGIRMYDSKTDEKICRISVNNG